MATLRAPLRVGAPPALTTICFPEGVRAVRTATIRDHPPLAAIGTVTVGEPKISSGFASRALVRTALPFRAKVDTPEKTTVAVFVFGSALNVTALPVKFSGAISTPFGSVSQPARSEERRVGKECRCGWTSYAEDNRTVSTNDATLRTTGIE